jgi:N-acetylmuramoyl-L-alanine amidase
LNFASKVQKQYCEKIGRADKGVKRASLWVLWRTYMPSLLTEIGYLTNLQEEHFLGSVKGQEYIASGLFRAFREYKDELEGTVKKYDDEFEHQVRYTLCKADSLEIESAQKVLTPVKPDTAAVEKENTNVKDTVKKVANTNTSSVIKTPVPEKKLETSKLQPKVDEVKKQVLVYKVQLLSSDKKIPFNSEQLKKVEILGEYIENGFYKYTSGQFLSFEEANIMKQKLRKLGFKDAFVIGMQNGKRVPIKQ